ncbi:unnamed protein product [Paramecium octaurelia]|uniref:Uncharacterized protein n=1 Tax=Paramecium octaurelia TaxID=43137 RepID=A0A8S1UK41_PAROT|nr:unnamed protein product [Paramecium octaurelia]
MNRQNVSKQNIEKMFDKQQTFKLAQNLYPIRTNMMTMSPTLDKELQNSFKISLTPYNFVNTKITAQTCYCLILTQFLNQSIEQIKK